MPKFWIEVLELLIVLFGPFLVATTLNFIGDEISLLFVWTSFIVFNGSHSAVSHHCSFSWSIHDLGVESFGLWGYNRICLEGRLASYQQLYSDSIR